MQHARSEIPPYKGNTADYSCAMGAWGGPEARCHNAAHMWTLGWSTPALDLDLSTVLPNQPAFMTIPMQLSGPTGLKLSYAEGGYDSFVASYRGTNYPYDRPFIELGGVSEGVVVHRIPSGVANTDTALVALLRLPGDEWSDPTQLLSVTLVELDNASATVAVCRKSSPHVPCYLPPGALSMDSSDLVEHPSLPKPLMPTHQPPTPPPYPPPSRPPLYPPSSLPPLYPPSYPPPSYPPPQNPPLPARG